MYIVTALLKAPGVAETLIASIAVAIIVVGLLHRKPRAIRVVSGLLALSVGLIVTATMTPGHADSGRSIGFRFHNCLSYFPAEAARINTILPVNLEGLLNIGLYIPAAIFGYLLIKRWYVILAAGSALSCAIEMYQGLTGTRTCSGSDWTHNTTGVALGILLGLAIGKLLTEIPSKNPGTRRSGTRCSRPGRCSRPAG